MKSESESNKERRVTDNVLFCGGLLWIISVTKIKRLIDLVFGWFLIDLLECIGLCDRRAKGFKVSEYFVIISVLIFIEK